MMKEKQINQRKSEKFNRRQRRELEKSSKVFNSLMNQFIEHESMNTYKAEGILMYQPGFTKKFRSLHEQWKFFVNRWNAYGKHSIRLKVSAFADRVQEFLHKHEKEIWISYTQHLIVEKYGMDEQDYRELEKQFSRRLSCNDAAIEHVMKIKAA